jgi:hypothetical protein
MPAAQHGEWPWNFYRPGMLMARTVDVVMRPRVPGFSLGSVSIAVVSRYGGRVTHGP